MNETSDLYKEFLKYNILELENLLNKAVNREEILFYHRVLALKMGLEQEKIVGKQLL